MVEAVMRRLLLPYQVVRAVARCEGTDAASLRAWDKRREMVMARCIAAGLLDLRGWNRTEIGWSLHRDRATARNACRKCRVLAETDPEFRRRLAVNDAALRALERRALG